MRRFHETLELLEQELVAEQREQLSTCEALDRLAGALGSARCPADGDGASSEDPQARLADVQEQLRKLRIRLDHRRRARAKRTAEALERLGREVDHVLDLSVLGELSASVAHEIRNPLCGIMLSVEVLQTKMDPGDSRTVLLENLHRESEKMEKIVNNLLHFARRYRPHLSRCDLVDVVWRSIESVKYRLRKKRIEVQVRRSAGECRADVDPDLLQQVFANILANSADACAAGSLVEVTLAPADEGRSVAVTIRDPGEGIPEEALDRIFDPFYTSKHNGVGLGLSVSRKIVDAHGGRVEVSSQVGKGTAFRVVLARQARPEPAEVAA